MEKRKKKLIIGIENFEIVKEKFKEKGSKETRKQEEKKSACSNHQRPVKCYNFLVSNKNFSFSLSLLS